MIHKYDENNKRSIYFLLNELRSRVKSNDKLFTNKNNLRLKINLLDKNNQIIYSFREKCLSYPEASNSTRADGSLKNLLISSQSNLGNFGLNDKCLSHMQVFKNTPVFFDIQSQKDFWFVIELDDLESLQNFKRLQIQFVNGE